MLTTNCSTIHTMYHNTQLYHNTQYCNIPQDCNKHDSEYLAMFGTLVLLWLSALKLAKNFNSTSFNLKQEFFIRRDEEKTRRWWFPYFLGLSESYKKIFKYTPVQVCFKGVNTLKSMLMHPKDKISNDQKKDLVYHWECKADGCNSSYIGETSSALGERVKEHCQSTTSAILKHCKDFHHPLPSVLDCNIIDKNPSQITREAKEATHIRKLDPNLKRNIDKMSIPHCFDHLLGAKPKHPRVGALAQVAPQPVDDIAPPSQIPGLNLTQFNNIGNFRPSMAQHIPRPSTRACRARNLFNWPSTELPSKINKGQAL